MAIINTTTLIFLNLLSLFYITTSARTNTLLNDAVSGFNSTSLTHELPSKLKSLRSASNIPSFWANQSAEVTTFDGVDHYVQSNGITINNGSLVIYEINNFQVEDSRKPPPLDCAVLDGDDGGPIDINHSFKDARNALRAKGYSLMASFLGLQMTAFSDELTLTIFAPTDESLISLIHNMSSLEPVFLSHIVPCKIYMNGLFGSEENGFNLRTFLEGFLINVTTDGNNVTLNGVKVIAPKMYNNTWLIVHGLAGNLVDKRLMHNLPSPTSCGNCNLPRRWVALAFFTVLAIILPQLQQDKSFASVICFIVHVLLAGRLLKYKGPYSGRRSQGAVLKRMRDGRMN